MKTRVSLIVARSAIIAGGVAVLVGLAIRELVLFQCQPVSSATAGQTEAVSIGGRTCFIAPWVGQARGILLGVGTVVCLTGIVADKIMSLLDKERRGGA